MHVPTSYFFCLDLVLLIFHIIALAYFDCIKKSNIRSFSMNASFDSSISMKLRLSDLSDSYSSLSKLLIVVNTFFDSQEYALIKKRTKISKKKVLRKTVFKCDKKENSKSQDFEKKDTTSRFCECSFEVVVTLQLES